jgi:hypothetical protein
LYNQIFAEKESQDDRDIEDGREGGEKEVAEYEAVVMIPDELSKDEGNHPRRGTGGQDEADSIRRIEPSRDPIVHEYWHENSAEKEGDKQFLPDKTPELHPDIQKTEEKQTTNNQRHRGGQLPCPGEQKPAQNRSNYDEINKMSHARTSIG